MRNYRLYAAAMAALGITTTLYAAEPTREELQQELDELKAKVAQLEDAQQNFVNKQDVDATVKAILQDADQRSKLFAMEGFTAGYTDGKFILQSSDGNFMLHPWLQFQVRNATSWRIDGKNPNGTDDIQNGFEIRRMRFAFDGNAFSKDLTYLFQFNSDRHDGHTFVEDAWARYQFADTWAFRVGQFKDPLAHDSLVSSKYFLAAERSYTNDFFSNADNYVQGASLIYGNPHTPLHVEAAFTDGANIMDFNGNRANFNQNFEDFSTNNANYGGAARVEYLVMGDWKNYTQYSAYNVKEETMVVGAGVDYTEIGHAGFLTTTADAQYQNPNGISLYAAWYGKYTKDDPAGLNVTSTQDLFDWGAIAQAGYMINRKWEVFARYGYLHLDGDFVPAGFDNEVHEITVGTNYYFVGHAAKFTLDFGWLPSGAPLNDDGADILQNKSATYYLRGQFQLLL
jgi:hypothetical protein